MSEPSVPPPDEPKTPMWLPALGAALLLLLGIWWAIRAGDTTPRDTGDKAASGADAGAG
jgi:hypothetical protein